MCVDDVPVAVCDQGAQPFRPQRVSRPFRQAMASHTGPFEALGQMVLLRNDVCAFDGETTAIVRFGRRCEQVLGAARPEALDEPQHPDHHAVDASPAGIQSAAWLRGTCVWDSRSRRHRSRVA